MDVVHLKESSKRKKADALVLPFWRGKQEALPATPLEKNLAAFLTLVQTTKDFRGNEGEITFLYVEGQPEKRFILLGLGDKDKATSETLRRSFGCLTKSCLSKRIKEINLLIPHANFLKDQEILRGVVEGLLLPNYIYDRQKHKDLDEPENILLQKVTLIGTHTLAFDVAKKTAAICEGVYYARDLVNGNADEVTPYFLAECAKALAKKQRSIKTTVFDKKRIEKENLSLLLAVNRGSALEPAFIMMSYKGNPHSSDHTVIVGKGITYDTGGLNLKPSGSMETMKCDMAGGGVCFGVILAVSLLKLKVNLTVVIPSTENCIDAKSFKPGDVYKSYLGKTVEMTNSDAEGRLILADALAYAVNKLHPTRVIDIATLTGAIEIALGTEASGVMSTNDELAYDLIKAGEATYERLWRMPLFDEYKERLKSDIADLKSWNGRPAGASVAATFLRQFVKESIPWAHIDIAGTAFLSEGKKYQPKYATGFGVRLLIDYLEQLEKEN